MIDTPLKQYKRGLDLSEKVYMRNVRLEFYGLVAGLLPMNLRAEIQADASGPTCTYMKKDGLAVVRLSLSMPCTAAGVDPLKPILSSSVWPAARRLKLAQITFILHEIAHLRHTDMSGKAFDDIDARYAWAKQFIHDVSNVLEDPVAEKELANSPYCEYAKSLFEWLVKRMFIPQAKNYVDDGSVESLVNYLLLYVRCGANAIASPNAIFDSLKPKGVEGKLKALSNERDPKARCRGQIAFAIWLIDELGLKQSDMPKQALTPDRPVVIIVDKLPGGKAKRQPLQPMPSSLPPVSIVEAGEDDGDGVGDSGGDNLDADIIDLRKNKPQKKGESGSGESDSPGSAGEGDGTDPSGAAGETSLDIGADDPVDIALENGDDENLENALKTDALMGKYSNAYNGESYVYLAEESVVVRDESQAHQAFDSAASQLGMLPAALGDAIVELKAEAAPVERHYLPEGDEIDIEDYIDVKASRSLSMDVFKEEVKGREITDLSVSLLVDCSGSMGKSRSRVAFAASVMVALACDEADVPTEVAAFSTGGILYLKRFDEDLSKAKTFLGLLSQEAAGASSSNSSGTRGVSLWGGTDCEGALTLLLGDLRKYKGKESKLVFIITDGDTGSPATTGEIVKDAREEGIVVIGIGIGTSEANLRKCFGHCKSFDEKSLGQLPSYVAQEIQDAIESKEFQGY